MCKVKITTACYCSAEQLELNGLNYIGGFLPVILPYPTIISPQSIILVASRFITWSFHHILRSFRHSQFVTPRGTHGSIKDGPIRVLFFNRELRITDHYT